MAARLANTMSNSLKGRPVQVASCSQVWRRNSQYYLFNILFPSLQGRVFQGKEPPQFIALFQPMVILKVSLLYYERQ